MFRKVAPYIGEYKKYTVWAAVMMSLGIIANVIPYYFLYQIISPLTRGEHISLTFVMLRVLAVAVCEIAFAIFYVKGLEFSHISAYNTLKNLRVSLQGKLEKQPLGNIQNLGTGRIKKVFTDDIDAEFKMRSVHEDAFEVSCDEKTPEAVFTLASSSAVCRWMV